MSALKTAQTHVTQFLEEHPEGLIVVLGPTASGKTGLSVDLAKFIETLKRPGQGPHLDPLPSVEEDKNASGGSRNWKAEIISVDSRQIYRGCDISSAKITPEEKQGVVHHGLDLVALEDEYSVYDWQQYCFKIIEQIQARGHVPILAGGTMLWLDAVTENYKFSTDDRSIGTSEHRNNKGFLKSTEKCQPRWPSLKLGLHWPRDLLYERINQRAVQQFESGLIEETRDILERFDLPSPNPSQREGGKRKQITQTAFTSFGYQEIEAYLTGLITYNEALRKNQQRNRNYAKKQLTWWRGREDVVWLEMG